MFFTDFLKNFQRFSMKNFDRFSGFLQFHIDMIERLKNKINSTVFLIFELGKDFGIENKNG